MKKYTDITYQQILEELEKRPTTFPPHVIAAKKARFPNIFAIGAFEDVVVTPETEKLMHLLAEGKITKKEGIELISKYA